MAKSCLAFIFILKLLWDLWAKESWSYYKKEMSIHLELTNIRAQIVTRPKDGTFSSQSNDV